MTIAHRSEFLRTMFQTNSLSSANEELGQDINLENQTQAKYLTPHRQICRQTFGLYMRPWRKNIHRFDRVIKNTPGAHFVLIAMYPCREFHYLWHVPNSAHNAHKSSVGSRYFVARLGQLAEKLNVSASENHQNATYRIRNYVIRKANILQLVASKRPRIRTLPNGGRRDIKEA